MMAHAGYRSTTTVPCARYRPVRDRVVQFIPGSTLKQVLFACFPQDASLRGRLILRSAIDSALDRLIAEETVNVRRDYSSQQRLQSCRMHCTLTHKTVYLDFHDMAIQLVTDMCFGSLRCQGRVHLNCLTETQLM